MGWTCRWVRVFMPLVVPGGFTGETGTRWYSPDMGPLSAVAIAVTFLIFGLTQIAWITASAHALGVIFLIASVVVLLDAFWINSYARYSAVRGRPVA